MVNILYKIDGNVVKVEDVRDPTMLGAGETISRLLTPLECPVCKKSNRITIIIGGGIQFSVKAKDPCHIEFYRLANDSVPDTLYKFSE